MIPSCRLPSLLTCLTAAVLALSAVAAAAQEPDADDLAVWAAEVHEAHCAAMQGTDVQAAVEGYQVVAGVWGELDAALKGSEVPQPYLLYWRGLLAQCLDKEEEAATDLEGFLQAAAFLGAVDVERKGLLDAMVRDSKRRLKRLGQGAKGPVVRRGGVTPRPSRKTTREDEQDATAEEEVDAEDGDRDRGGRGERADREETLPERDTPARHDVVSAVPLHVRRQRGAGAALLIAGSLAAGGGFALNAGMYQRYYQPSTGDQATYEWASGMATTGFVVGLAGAALGVTGFIVLVAPPAGTSRVALVPGPVPALSVRF